MSNDTIYVSDEKLSRILAFDTHGNYKFGIYSTIYNPDSVSEPKGISEDKVGNIYICDEATGRILKVDNKFSVEDMDFSNIPFTLGNYIGQFPFLIYPQKIQEDEDGNIYVLDYGATIGTDLGVCSRILKFSSDLKYKSVIVDHENFRFITDFIIDKEFIFLIALSGIFKLDLNGKIVTKNTSLAGLEQISKGNDGYLYIADGVSSINLVDTDLNLVKKIGEGILRDPQDVSISEEGDIYVADTGNSRIAVFDKNGNYKFSFGKFGNGENEFINPTRIFIRDKDIFVSDPYASTVKVFDLSGNFKRYVVSSKLNFGASVYPKKIATNSSGMLEILDGYLGRVFLYDNGKYFASFNIFSDYSKRF
ncbi:MAG: 6-bladed beta-propeller [Deferribacterales bacterium]